MRIATFNMENFDDASGERDPTLEERIAVMRPQLLRIDADVLCLQEVNGQEDEQGNRSFSALDTLLAGSPYETFHREHTSTVGGDIYLERNLLILSRDPIQQFRQLRDSDGPRPSYQYATADPPDDTADLLNWERPIMHVEIATDNGPLHIFNTHLKSKIATTVKGQKLDRYTWKSISAWAEGSFVSAMKRMGQAVQIRLLIDELFDTHGLDTQIAVCGDLNSTIDDVPVRAIAGFVEDTGNREHTPRMLIPCENNIAPDARFTLYHLGRPEMLDHLLASRALFSRFRAAEIHNEYVPDESGAFRTDDRFPDSDHAPVVAEFE